MTTIDESILDVEALLREPGINFEFGCHESDSQKYIELATQKYPHKPYCLAKDWVVWDVEVSDEEKKEFEANGIQPVVVHVKFVLEDPTGRTVRGDYRISTPLIEMSEPCYFVTHNTVYILEGTGTRKTANAKDVCALYY